MSTSSTSGIHVGIHGEQLPNALQRHYLLFATLATQRPSVSWAPAALAWPWHAPASFTPPSTPLPPLSPVLRLRSAYRIATLQRDRLINVTEANDHLPLSFIVIPGSYFLHFSRDRFAWILGHFSPNFALFSARCRNRRERQSHRRGRYSKYARSSRVECTISFCEANTYVVAWHNGCF